MVKELWDKGLAVRKEVLGAEYVERNVKAADDFSLPMQEYATEACWGWLWTRPQFPRKMRSLINLAMLSALNRPHEFKVHVKGALTNGCTREEIREVLLQVAVYCGVPAGDIADPHRLGIRLWVNGELMQDSHTSKLIFDTAEQIAMLSSRVTLHPGDLVLTGTPAGVGMGRGRFLKAGDTVKLWIESIGELVHTIA